MDFKSSLNSLEKWPIDKTYKPKYLLSLENYIKQESAKIMHLKDENEKASLNLQIYREVFTSIITTFKTYGPVMAHIKDEYDKFIKFQSRKIEELQPLHQALFSMASQFDDQIVNLQAAEKTEVNHLKFENISLKANLEQIVLIKAKQAEKITQLEKELQISYGLYKDEKDGRDMVIKELSKLSLEKENSKLSIISQADTNTSQVQVNLTNEDYEALQNEYRLLLESYKEVLMERDELRDKITFSK